MRWLRHVRGAWVVLAAAFAVSRVVYVLMGVRFDCSPLGVFVQYLDPALLKGDLLRSVFYMHFQPPGFNLFLGAVLKACGDNYAAGFQGVFVGMGLLFALFIYELMVEMGVEKRLALVLAVVHTVLPTTVLYENWLFYSYPLAVLLCGSGWMLARFVKGYGAVEGVLFFATLVLISTIHAMYGAAWFLVILAGVMVGARGQRRMVMGCAAVPLLIVVGLTVKQYALFGTFTTGASYTGPNLAFRMALLGEIPAAEQERLVASGKVPAFFFWHPLLPLSVFREYLPEVPVRGVAALDEEVKSTGEPNFNHVGYLMVGDAYLKGVKAVVREHPEYYVRTFAGTTAYFRPAGDEILTTQVRGGMFERVERWGSWICTGATVKDGRGWVLMLGLPLLAGYGVFESVRRLRRGARGTAMVAGFMVFNIVYTTGLTVAVTWGDWARYRFGVDAFFVVLLGMGVSGTWRVVRGLRAGGGAPARVGARDQSEVGEGVSSR